MFFLHFFFIPAQFHLCLQPSIAFEQQVGQQAICSLQFSQQVVPSPTDTKPSSRRSPPGKTAMPDEPLHTRSEKATGYSPPHPQPQTVVSQGAWSHTDCFAGVQLARFGSGWTVQHPR